MSQARATLETLFEIGLRAVDADAATRRAIVVEGGSVRIAGQSLSGKGQVVVAALGKAASVMAQAACDVLGERIRDGLVVTKDGHARPGLGLPQLEAGHPVPDARSAEAADRLIELAASCGADDCLLVLLSGGASALGSAPAAGLSADELAEATGLLLESGADIGELNCVRKHLTRVGGGRLGAATHAAQVIVLVVSDVVGDPLDVIGSGPCIGDPTRYADALEVLRARGLEARMPAAVLAHLRAGVAGKLPESVSPGDPRLARVHHEIVARNADARSAIERSGRARDLEVVALGECLAGEAAPMGRRLAALAAATDAPRPLLIVAGGESVVTLGPEHGLGGRNQELALAAGLALEEAGEARVTLLAGGTDGTDGPTTAAGGVVDLELMSRARTLGLDARRALARHDANPFLEAAGAALRTGPTGTNVMDLVLALVMPAPGR